MAVDDLVENITIYKSLPKWLQNGHTIFITLYGISFYFCLNSWFGDGFREELYLIPFSIGVFQILLMLCCLWSVHVRCFLAYKQVDDPKVAEIVKIVPTPNNGHSELIQLQRSMDPATTKWNLYFYFQKTKYIWDSKNKYFHCLKYPIDKTFGEYLQCKGYADDNEFLAAQQHFNINIMDMVVPEFSELFIERATAPFFVFQVVCVMLWCLDRYWYYSLFTLMMLFVFECTLVKQQLRNMALVRNMGNKPYSMQVYRNKRWKSIQSDNLIPGDIISIGRSHNNTVPCDLLLLRGPCIVDESMLTGESVPQMKEPIESFLSDTILDVDAHGKLHILFGGTKVVQHTPPSKTSAGIRAQDNGCIAYVLRTSFNTSQGKLLRTILFGVKRVTANNLETLAFILFLLIFAIAAASYVWVKGTEDPKRNRYKLFLECILILTSVIPPELPVELSLAVNSSLVSLSKLGVFCTEPFRIPFAGKVEICCFDKTGTLTSNDLVIEGIAGIEGKVLPISDAPVLSVQVLATCHSLVHLDDGIVGDPLEKTTLTSIDWILTKGDAVIPRRGRYPGMKIFQRFHFSSSLKRMSVLAGYTLPGHTETNYIASVKGAPETLKSMFVKVDDTYDSTYLGLSRRGARVLALGWKELGHLSHQQVKDISRESLESDLMFAGFIVVSCPLKPDSKSVIKELLKSSHMVVMITGDNPLTACHVAKELLFLRKSGGILLLSNLDNTWFWCSIDETIKLPLTTESKKLTSKYDFCITGDGLLYLNENEPELLKTLLPYISIFARVSPKQKEFVIVNLKSLGYTTLMCGDGTNDVGALKQADVGVALILNLSDGVENKTHKLRGGERTKPEKLKVTTTVTNRSMADRKALNANLEKLLEEADDGPKIVKLGDASIAAPFTSKLPSIQCVCHIIKQGRCTLVTTLQMFKILALNALILAYSQSVLYVDGVKFSDIQATLQGLLLAGCFLFISRSQPLKTLSPERPLPNIFNVYTISTVLLQFMVHLTFLVFLVYRGGQFTPLEERELPMSRPETNSTAIDEEMSEFKPTVLNSTVYIISAALQIATFAINYRGHPYMESLFEHKPLLYTLLASGSMVMALAFGLVPNFSTSFDIAEFDGHFRMTLIAILIADFVIAYILDRICRWLFGEGNLRLIH